MHDNGITGEIDRGASLTHYLRGLARVAAVMILMSVGAMISDYMTAPL